MPGAAAATRCRPGSMGNGAFRAAPFSGSPSRVRRRPAGGSAILTSSRASRSSSASRCARAKPSRSFRPSRRAISSTERSSAQAVASFPTFSWHTARLRSVPGFGSRRWLSWNLSQASGNCPRLKSSRPCRKSASATGLTARSARCAEAAPDSATAPSSTPEPRNESPRFIFPAHSR
ncbi:hypothetical protein SCE1572_33525 [Sorangium cellulosum So0157-2]|uniref:Uncharacterized protein n=1 Tax=Sorangium cellulosum So0157-2 TaxID=1254432 RepID=S4Y469_SORCE|nr:hypothetical protein SCE1572_33525 [Sorangium cellulosum So0157-2]